MRARASQVNSDTRCGRTAHLLGADADYHAIVIIDAASGEVTATVPMRERPRRIVLHPSKDIAYIVFEEAGEVAVYSWPACEAWLKLGAASAPPTELQAVPTHPAADEKGPFAALRLDIPTSLLLTRKGDFAYSCTRAMFGLDFTPTAKVGVFAVAADGTLAPIQWIDTGARNTRDCALSPDDGLLLAVDVLSDRLLAFRRDPATGRLTLGDTATVPVPTMLTSFVPGTKACGPPTIGTAAPLLPYSEVEGEGVIHISLALFLVIVLTPCCCGALLLRLCCRCGLRVSEPKRTDPPVVRAQPQPTHAARSHPHSHALTSLPPLSSRLRCASVRLASGEAKLARPSSRRRRARAQPPRRRSGPRACCRTRSGALA